MIFDYTCEKCGFTDEYIESFSVSKDLKCPDICPKCNEGKMIKQSSFQNISFDVPGGYDYEYGKKAWQKNKSPAQQASIMSGESSPY